MPETFKTFQGTELVNFFKSNQLRLPAIKGWNRLEGRPRTENFDKTLRAEIHDALWILSRQWQFGEFNANDAGSPVFAKVKLSTIHIDRYQVKEKDSQPYDESIPLEALVEREQIPMTLPLRLQIARYWTLLLKKATMNGDISRDYIAEFMEKYPIEYPPDNGENEKIFAHQEVWQMNAAIAGRGIDGGLLFRDIIDGQDIPEIIGVEDTGDQQAIQELSKRLIAWFKRQYTTPDNENDSAWAPSYLEYKFNCSAPKFTDPGQIVLVADEYCHGYMDWFSFDIHPGIIEIKDPVVESKPVYESLPNRAFDLIPTNIEFGGMPNVRWWEFENRKTSFGDIDVHTTDIAKLLLIEFGLIYANDWFLIPIELPSGSLAKVIGLAVTNVFGERLWIDAAGSDTNKDWQRWAMYNLNVRGIDGPVDQTIFIPPVVDRLQESKPIELVKLIRDEMANMVWGVESRILLDSGEVKDGFEAATEVINYLKRTYSTDETEEEPTIPESVKIKYRLMSSVPENWIPFIPVKMDKDTPINREIQLQRAAMLRTLFKDSDPPKIIPRTDILRYNVEGSYFIHEEEVPRAGVQVSRTYQRARWYNGRVCVWLGRRKRTGKGEGSSGLRFDQIEAVKGKK